MVADCHDYLAVEIVDLHPREDALGELTATRQRATDELDRIGTIINNLLDNITSTNRQLVDNRLAELTRQRQQIETRNEELELLSASQAEITHIVADSMQFLASLEFTLRQGLPQEKLVALRQCITRIYIHKPKELLKAGMHDVPVANMATISELQVTLSGEPSL